MASTPLNIEVAVSYDLKESQHRTYTFLNETVILFLEVHCKWLEVFVPEPSFFT